jgi:hypothetical protein
MSSPYRHAVAVLRERREQVANDLGETDTVLAKLMTERMRLRIELDALEARLSAVRRSPLDASPETRALGASGRRGSVLIVAIGPVVAFGVATACSAWATPDAPDPPRSTNNQRLDITSAYVTKANATTPTTLTVEDPPAE